jgi:hypothetical protein
VVFVVVVVVPSIALVDKPEVRLLSPSAVVDLPSITVVVKLLGATGCVDVVVVRDDDEVEVCAIAPLVTMPSAMAPANKNLVIYHALQGCGREGFRAGLVVDI